MASKALIITPTPTHPDNAGNRKGVLQICNTLRHLGYELDCVYFPFEGFDSEQMSNYFKGNLFIPDKHAIYSNKPRLAYILKRLREKIIRTFFLNKKEQDQDSLRFNFLIDESVPVYINHWFKKNIDVHSYKLVVCEYVWMSRFLNYFPDHVFKIIDTHDIFSNRYKIYQKINKPPEWISLFPSEEAKGLQRANLLVSVNDEEKEYFQKLSGIKCIRFGFMPENNFIKKDIFEFKLLYFASANQLNLKSIEWFLSEVWSAIVSAESKAQLLIGGRICSVLKTNSPQVSLLGEFDNPHDFYSQGDIIINPEQSGTGLKIKAIEAFSYGLPLVATKEGVMGAGSPFLNHYIEANSASDFATAVIELFTNTKKRGETVENARKWLENLRVSTENELRDHLNINS